MAELNSTPPSNSGTATPDDSEFPLIPTRPVPAGAIGCNWVTINYNAAKQGRRGLADLCQSFVLDPSLPEPDGMEPYIDRKTKARYKGIFLDTIDRLNLDLAAALVDIDLWIIGPSKEDGHTDVKTPRERRKVHISIVSGDLNLRIHSIDDSYEVLFDLNASRRLDLALPRSYQGVVKFFTNEAPGDPRDLLMFSPSMRTNISHIDDNTVLRQYFIGTYSRLNESVLHMCLAKKVRVRFVDQPNPPVPPPPPVQPKPVSWWSWLWPFGTVTEGEPAW